MTEPTVRRPFTDAASYYDVTGNLTTFKPVGKPMILNKRGIAPPSLGARIIVETDILNLSMAVAPLRPKHDLMIFEPGVYRPKSGREVTLPGAQTVIFNSEQLDKETFTAAMMGLGKVLGIAFKPSEIYVEVRDGEFAVSSQYMGPVT